MPCKAAPQYVFVSSMGEKILTPIFIAEKVTSASGLEPPSAPSPDFPSLLSDAPAVDVAVADAAPGAAVAGSVLRLAIRAVISPIWKSTSYEADPSRPWGLSTLSVVTSRKHVSLHEHSSDAPLGRHDNFSQKNWALGPPAKSP